MRLMKRILSAAAVLALSASLLVGCSSGTASSVPVSASSAAESTVSSVEETASSAVDENEAAAAQLLNDLTGSYGGLCGGTDPGADRVPLPAKVLCAGRGIHRHQGLNKSPVSGAWAVPAPRIFCRNRGKALCYILNRMKRA